MLLIFPRHYYESRMTAAKAKTKPRRKRQAGQQPHRPTPQTLATVRAMSGCGYPQRVIARHINISEPSLRKHYRQMIDFATEESCARVFVNLVRTASTGNDTAAVQAGKFILSCRGGPGWREVSRIEFEQTRGDGLAGLRAMEREADAAARERDALGEPDTCYTDTPVSAMMRH